MDMLQKDAATKTLSKVFSDALWKQEMEKDMGLPINPHQ